MAEFTPEMLEQLKQPEGAIPFDYTFSEVPEGPPAQPTAIVSHADPGLMANVAILPDGNLGWTLNNRAAGVGGQTWLDVTSLMGESQWTIHLVWSPDGLELAAGAGDQLLDTRSGS